MPTPYDPGDNSAYDSTAEHEHYRDRGYKSNPRTGALILENLSPEEIAALKTKPQTEETNENKHTS